MKRKIVEYIRVSSYFRVGSSNQTSNIDDIYKDISYSGLNSDRPALNKLIKDIKNDEIGQIIIRNSSRISRDEDEYNKFLKLCNEHDVEILIQDSFFQKG